MNFVTSPLIAEALALRSALTAALNLDLTRIKMFSGNSTLIRAINNDVQIKEISGIVKDINSTDRLYFRRYLLFLFLFLS